MDRDAIALTGVVLSGVALLATANLAWLVMLFLSCAYGGWRFGQRLMPPESTEV